MLLLQRMTVLTVGFALSAAAAAEVWQSEREHHQLEPRGDFGYVLPMPDLEKIRTDDAKATGGPFRYGVVIPTPQLDLAAGTWSMVDEHRRSWQIDLLSPGATSLDVHFERFKLPKDAELYLSSGDGKVTWGPYDASHASPGDGRFYSPYVPGERVVIKLVVPAAAAAQVDLAVAGVTHGYRGFFEADRGVLKSGSCNVDVACSLGNGWGDQIDSVGHYTFVQSGSSYVCTGSLIANTGNTTAPLFLTANHCVSSSAVANSVVVYWNYQSGSCRTPGSSSSGTPLSRSIATHSQSGSTLVANHSASDFALLRLNQDVPAASGPFWSGWDRRDQSYSSAVGIHHPAGHEKRISNTTQALGITGYLQSSGGGTTHLRVPRWTNGTTEGGSSGSGLWNADQRLIGQLHGGYAACGNTRDDWYGRLAVSWNGGGTSTSRLRDHLDPGGTAANTSNGYRAGSTPPPPPPPNELSNGVPVTGLAASTGQELRYTIAVPAGASNLSIAISGGSGDADLYVRFGSAPTTGTWDCRPYRTGNNETCSFAAPSAGTYHVMVRAYSTFSGVSLVASYQGSSQPSFFQNTTRYDIPDLGTIESPISVNRSGNAPSNLRVAVDIRHTYRGDLEIDLIAPSGSSFRLKNASGSDSAANVIATYTVNASAQSANGTWRLRVRDRYSGDVGYLQSWSLQF